MAKPHQATGLDTTTTIKNGVFHISPAVPDPAGAVPATAAGERLGEGGRDDRDGGSGGGNGEAGGEGGGEGWGILGAEGEVLSGDKSLRED